jgi:hypothetical protein
MPLFAMPRKVETQVVDLSIKKSYVHDDWSVSSTVQIMLGMRICGIM